MSESLSIVSKDFNLRPRKRRFSEASTLSAFSVQSGTSTTLQSDSGIGVNNTNTDQGRSCGNKVEVKKGEESSGLVNLTPKETKSRLSRGGRKVKTKKSKTKRKKKGSDNTPSEEDNLQPKQAPTIESYIPAKRGRVNQRGSSASFSLGSEQQQQVIVSQQVIITTDCNPKKVLQGMQISSFVCSPEPLQVR